MVVLAQQSVLHPHGHLSNLIHGDDVVQCCNDMLWAGWWLCLLSRVCCTFVAI